MHKRLSKTVNGWVDGTIKKPPNASLSFFLAVLVSDFDTEREMEDREKELKEGAGLVCLSPP